MLLPQRLKCTVQPSFCTHQMVAEVNQRFSSYTVQWTVSFWQKKVYTTRRSVTRGATGHNALGAKKPQQCRKYSLQYIVFTPIRPQVRTWGAKPFSCPGRYLASVYATDDTSFYWTSIISKSNKKCNWWFYATQQLPAALSSHVVPSWQSCFFNCDLFICKSSQNNQ